MDKNLYSLPSLGWNSCLKLFNLVLVSRLVLEEVLEAEGGGSGVGHFQNQPSHEHERVVVGGDDGMDFRLDGVYLLFWSYDCSTALLLTL